LLDNGDQISEVGLLPFWQTKREITFTGVPWGKLCDHRECRNFARVPLEGTAYHVCKNH
jgi:hypothetical protein